jgi:hypothetical protein
LRQLFKHHFDPPIDPLSGKSVNRPVDAIALLAFYDEAILETCGIPWITRVATRCALARSESIDARTETE